MHAPSIEKRHITPMTQIVVACAAPWQLPQTRQMRRYTIWLMCMLKRDLQSNRDGPLTRHPCALRWLLKTSPIPTSSAFLPAE